MRRAHNSIDEDAPANVFALLHNERKKLITPFVPDEDMFVKQWEQDEYQPGYFSEQTPLIYSNRGERVRSKTEKIIADKYFEMGIPYKYEKPLLLRKQTKTITVLPARLFFLLPISHIEMNKTILLPKKSKMSTINP